METAGDAGLSEGEINKDRDRKLSGGMESGENNKCSPTKRVSESAANEHALPETSQEKRKGNNKPTQRRRRREFGGCSNAGHFRNSVPDSRHAPVSIINLYMFSSVGLQID